MANIFDQFEQPQEANPFDQFDAPVQEQQVNSAGDLATATISGANTLLPGMAGIPMDTMNNIANLGIAGYGTARKEIGELFGEEGYIPPEPLGDPIGGSAWMKEKIAKASQNIGGGDPFAMPNPEDPTQQNLHLTGGILAAGALAPSQGIKQAASNVGRMAVPAAGAVGMKEAFPNQPLAPMLGMMSAPAAAQALKSAKGVIAPKVESTKAFMKAHKLGYKVPPALAKPTKTQGAIEGTAGPVPTKQKASIYNQKISNDLIKKDLNYPKDVPLSKEGLDSIRREAGQVYNQAKSVGTFKTDKAFMQDLSKISNQSSALAKEFPGMVKQDIVNLAKMFNKKKISSEALVESVKQLRADSSAGFRSQDPATLSLAKANGKMANALESLMERSIKTTKPDLLPALKSARQKIAKTYTIEKALKGENIDAVALGRQLDKGKPLSGIIKDVAEFGQNFKGAAQTNVPQSTNFRPMDLVAGVGGATATGNPWWLAAMGARPAMRSLILSKPYQSALAKAGKGQVDNIMTLPRESQAAAFIKLAEDIQKSGNSDSM